MNRRRVYILLVALGLVLALAPRAAGLSVEPGVVIPPGAVVAAPLVATPLGAVFTYQGMLKQSGAPANGTFSIQFRLLDAASAGSPLWTETQSIPVAGGVFTAYLGSSVPIPAGVFNGEARWLEIAVGGNVLSPRQPLLATPYALALPGLYTQPNATSPNLIGGFSGNSVTAGAVGATIGGGGAATNPTTGVGPNRVTDEYGTVGGGANNQAGNNAGTPADRPYATVGGGLANTAASIYGTVAGGTGNTAGNDSATVGGGQVNTASGPAATVGGGDSNTASGSRATVGGGQSNTAGGPSGNHTTVAGGSSNTASGPLATVGGGGGNTASGELATVGGGGGNRVTAAYGTIGGGGQSVVNNAATGNRVTDDYGTVGGGGNNQAGDNAGTTTDRRFATVGGGSSNTASGIVSTVGGGEGNTASFFAATVSGGQNNTASGALATVGGGGGSAGSNGGNIASGDYSTVSGGQFNRAGSGNATVGGGLGNTASGPNATVGGGQINTASASNATVGGGGGNTASGQNATVAGGNSNTAQGDFSFAAGLRAKANHRGAFVWADSFVSPSVGNPDFASTADDQFSARATGGVRFVTQVDTSTGAVTWSCSLTPPTPAGWSCTSDREAKTDFAPADGRAILDRLVALPIQTWSGLGEEPGIRHLGPMAQDFYAAFGLGDSDRHIASMDVDGVALAAIQGLYQLVREQAAQLAVQQEQITAQQEQIARLWERHAELDARLAALERGAGASAASESAAPAWPAVGWPLLGLGGLALMGLVRRPRRPSRVQSGWPGRDAQQTMIRSRAYPVGL